MCTRSRSVILVIKRLNHATERDVSSRIMCSAFISLQHVHIRLPVSSTEDEYGKNEHVLTKGNHWQPFERVNGMLASWHFIHSSPCAHDLYRKVISELNKTPAVKIACKSKCIQAVMAMFYCRDAWDILDDAIRACCHGNHNTKRMSQKNKTKTFCLIMNPQLRFAVDAFFFRVSPILMKG